MARLLDLREGEQLLAVAAAVEEVTGSRPHPTTVCRWIQKGAGGVVLRSCLVGSRRMTTTRAVREWINERSAGAVA
jgi:hypothetical protein